MNAEEKIKLFMNELRCTSCIHFEVCSEHMGGLNLSIVGAECRHYKHVEEVPKTCEGCCNIAFRYPYASMYPCISCVRANQKDYYNVHVED